MTTKKTKVLILDTETTGVSAKDEVIEIAWIEPKHTVRQWITDLIASNFDILTTNSYNEQFNPSVPINPHAYNVHGISKLKLLGKRPSTSVDLPENVTHLVGHNISFDYRMLGKPEGILLIDTLVLHRLLRKLGIVDDHSEGKNDLDTLIQYYYPEVAKQLIKPLHNAMDDCFKVVLLLNTILKYFPDTHTWEELYDLQNMGKKK